MVCPHAVIRAKVYDPKLLSSAPDSFKSAEAKILNLRAWSLPYKFLPKIAPVVVFVWIIVRLKQTNPKLKAINMVEQPPVREQEVKIGNFS